MRAAVMALRPVEDVEVTGKGLLWCKVVQAEEGPVVAVESEAGKVGAAERKTMRVRKMRSLAELRS